MSRKHQANRPAVSAQCAEQSQPNPLSQTRLLQTLRRTVVPTDLSTDDTQTRIKVKEVPPVNPFPSHLLVIEQDPPIRGERVRTYIPVHDVVLLAYTSNIRLPPRLSAEPRQIGEYIEITVPIARFGIPSPNTFNKLLSFLYSANQTQDHMAFFDDHLGYAGLPDNARIEAAGNLPRLLRMPFLKREDAEIWKPWARQTEGRLAAQVSVLSFFIDSPDTSFPALYDLLLRAPYQSHERCQSSI